MGRPITCGPDPINTNCFRTWGYNNILSNSNTSSYHSLEPTVTQRTQHGLSFVFGLHLLACSFRKPRQLELPVPDQQQRSETAVLFKHVRYPASLHRIGYIRDSRKENSKPAVSWTAGRLTRFPYAADRRRPWGVNDITSTDFSGTGEIGQPAIAGGFGRRDVELSGGNLSDFQTSHGAQQHERRRAQRRHGAPLFRRRPAIRVVSQKPKRTALWRSPRLRTSDATRWEAPS